MKNFPPPPPPHNPFSSSSSSSSSPSSSSLLLHGLDNFLFAQGDRYLFQDLAPNDTSQPCLLVRNRGHPDLHLPRQFLVVYGLEHRPGGVRRICHLIQLAVLVLFLQPLYTGLRIYVCICMYMYISIYLSTHTRTHVHTKRDTHRHTYLGRLLDLFSSHAEQLGDGQLPVAVFV